MTIVRWLGDFGGAVQGIAPGFDRRSVCLHAKFDALSHKTAEVGIVFAAVSASRQAEK